MATVKKKRISWTPPSDMDVVAHELWVVDQNDTIDSLNPADLRVDMPQVSVLLPDDFPAGTFSEDKNYKVGVCAVDDVGNKGDVAEFVNPFDFVAPGVPTNLTVEDA